jgi:hypothetical protein
MMTGILRSSIVNLKWSLAVHRYPDGPTFGCPIPSFRVSSTTIDISSRGLLGLPAGFFGAVPLRLPVRLA